MKAGAWLLSLLLGACASAPPTSPVARRAEADMQRAAQAYARGDLPAARRGYGDAARGYDSVADAAGRARALLSLARVETTAGQARAALALVDGLLGEPDGLDPALRPLALGRAAGLALGMGAIDDAAHRLDAAHAACAGQCAEAAALDILAARLSLSRNRAADALERADDVLARLTEGRPERADALRVRAEALLALGRASEATADAEAALGLDRRAGRADAVILDLDLSARSRGAAGDSAGAERHRALADRARAARRALLGLERTD